MKKTGLFVLLLATAAWAQSGDTKPPPIRRELRRRQPAFPPSGFRRPPTPTCIALDSSANRSCLTPTMWRVVCRRPSTTKFTRGDMIYLQGTGYTAGAEYEIVRALRDINEYEMYPGEKKLLKETGQPYEEVGRVKIIDTRNKTAIGQVEYACDGVNPGDTAIPFAEKQAVTFHAPARFDRLPARQQQTLWPHRDGQGFRFSAGNRTESLSQRRLQPGREDRRLLPCRAFV